MPKFREWIGDRQLFQSTPSTEAGRCRPRRHVQQAFFVSIHAQH